MASALSFANAFLDITPDQFKPAIGAVIAGLGFAAVVLARNEVDAVVDNLDVLIDDYS